MNWAFILKAVGAQSQCLLAMQFTNIAFFFFFITRAVVSTTVSFWMPTFSKSVGKILFGNRETLYYTWIRKFNSHRIKHIGYLGALARLHEAMLVEHWIDQSFSLLENAKAAEVNCFNVTILTAFVVLFSLFIRYSPDVKLLLTVCIHNCVSGVCVCCFMDWWKILLFQC